jgi:hypothetical protein
MGAAHNGILQGATDGADAANDNRFQVGRKPLPESARQASDRRFPGETRPMQRIGKTPATLSA